MKLYFYLFMLVSFVSGFNIKNPKDVCRTNVLYKLSKVSLMSIILNNCKSALADDNSNIITNINDFQNNINDELMNSHDFMQPEPLLLTIIENDIYFYSAINQKSCFELERVLIEMEKRAIKNNTTNTPIHLHIQSYGGSLHHSLYLIDLIKNMKTPVYTYIDGFAASAATLISVAGKKRFITKNSIMLIHQLSSGFEGKFSEIHDENENINNLMSFIVNYYLKNTNINKEELKLLLRRDLWLDSQKCLEYGLVDVII